MRDAVGEKLMGVTARLEAVGPAGPQAGGGFFYEVPTNGGQTETFLVSNRHQLAAAEDYLVLRTVRRSPAGTPAWGSELKLRIPAAADRCVGHPDPEVDVAVLPLRGAQPRFESVLAVSSDVAMSHALESRFDGLERVITIGYPNGLFDEVTLCPIAREGITATPLRLDYAGTPTFLIDAATFEGSSGSPVFVLPEPLPGDAPRPTVLGRRVVLAGVVAALHARDAKGDVARVDTASALQFTVRDPLHLGIVFKARTIDACIDAALFQTGRRRACASATELPRAEVAG